jgi:hypothetical protein
MLKSMRMISVFALLSGLSAAQSTPRPKFLDHALIQHGGSEVTVVANDPLPLLQAISDLRLEYGWQINWESAPGYSHFDLVDATDQKWRAAHPGEKGATRPAGGLFTATFAEPKEASDPGAERDALARLIDEYNATDNPGKYVLRVDADGQFTVVGTRIRDETGVLQEIQPLLDTPVTLVKAQRNVYDTVESILGALRSVTGKKVLFAVASSSLFINTQVSMGGERVPARDLLKQALASTKRPLQYDLCLNSDAPVYLLSVSLTMREQSNGLGGRKLVPVDRMARP